MHTTQWPICMTLFRIRKATCLYSDQNLMIFLCRISQLQLWWAQFQWNMQNRSHNYACMLMHVWYPWRPLCDLKMQALLHYQRWTSTTALPGVEGNEISQRKQNQILSCALPQTPSEQWWTLLSPGPRDLRTVKRSCLETFLFMLKKNDWDLSVGDMSLGAQALCWLVINYSVR